MKEKIQQQIFDEWLKKHKGLIFKILRAYAFTPMDREDLFQDITIQLWHSIPKFRGDSAVATWIYRVALNIAIKWIKKEQKTPRPESLEKAEHLLYENDFKMDDRLVWLYEQISQLSEIDRSITLLLLDDFSYKEMANILGITESNIGVKINRIKKQLIVKSKKYEHDGI
ncbi:RNA polymerase subunit sigma-70 [Pedobacter psychrophilus]|uniref:RNA polymerase subunit sigma-70 n=1 Tax=Pedobacter psychrophilus TaxID=1826909 RepID=A0A179DJB3_9SPHI|nr:sigma-70 family RNA polymerase sigma factor [Pedobacter psychrophilus]OAQ40523.1 RNA polymerase subunit sigma-70 [Pedobacter psychrophilus]